MARGSIHDSDLNDQEIEKFREYGERACKGVLDRRVNLRERESKVTVDAGVVGHWAYYHIAENLLVDSINWKKRIEKKLRDIEEELSDTEQHKKFLNEPEKNKLKAALSNHVSVVQAAIAELNK